MSGIALPRLGSPRWRGAAAALLAAAAWCACGDPVVEPRSGSNSNWLSPCTTAEECGGDTCLCGLCTPACTADADCAQLAEARCATPATPAAWAQCGTREPEVGLCLAACQPGECPSGRVCVGGACVLAPLANTAFCAGVPEPDPAIGASEEELLELLQVARRDGGLACGADVASASVPELRYDARAACAARAFAGDLATTRTMSTVDSAGRDTPDRLTLAGYPATRWGDAYAFEATDAAEALAIMVATATSCPLLVSSTFVEVGVGRSGDVFVITFASVL